MTGDLGATCTDRGSRACAVPGRHRTRRSARPFAERAVSAAADPRSHRVLVGGPDGDDEVVGTGPSGTSKPMPLQHLDVELGRHGDLGRPDAFESATARETCISVTESW